MNFFVNLTSCPRFSQNRVNFHQKLRGDTAGRLIQTVKTIRVFDTMCCHAGFQVEEMAGGKLVVAWEHAGGQTVTVAPHFDVYFVYSSYQYYCCYCLLCLLFC